MLFRYWGPYAVSKAGLEMPVKISAARSQRHTYPLTGSIPGIVRTRPCARDFPSEDPTRLPPPESVTDAFFVLALPESTRKSEVVAISDLEGLLTRKLPAKRCYQRRYSLSRRGIWLVFLNKLQSINNRYKKLLKGIVSLSIETSMLPFWMLTL